MPVDSKEAVSTRTETAPSVPSTIESAGWWLPSPGWFGGLASIGGVFGLIPFDSRRFNPAIDAVMLRRDGQMLMFEFKRAAKRSARELERQENAGQQLLFELEE